MRKRAVSKIGKEMILRLTLMIVIPVMTVGAFLVWYSCHSLYEQAAQQVESESLRVRSLLVDCLISTTNLAEEIAGDRQLQQYLMSEEENEQERLAVLQQVNDRINAILSKNTFLSSMHIYTNNTCLQESTYIQAATPEIEEQCFMKADVPSGVIWGLFPEVGRDSDNPELTMLYTFPLEKEGCRAILATTISSNYLRNRIQNNDLTTILSIDDSSIFFSTIRSLQETPMPIDIDYTKQYFTRKGTFSFEGEKQLGSVAAQPIYLSDNTIYVYTLKLGACAQIRTVGMINGLITFGVICAAVLGIMGYASYLSRRILSLRTSMEVAKDGNYDDIIASLKGDDELTETFEDLKALIEEIKRKDARMYEAQLREQEFINEQNRMEGKLLSSQINPHFIYNTLETIRMLALEAEDEEAAHATLLLAKSMRYVLDNTKGNLTTLDREIAYIEVYLQIQQIRFQERLCYRILVEKDVEPQNYGMLPLLLQPVVENSVVHGLESVARQVVITMEIGRETEDCLCIRVSDNGSGIEADRLAALQESLRSGAKQLGGSIGICNVQNRIRLYYGEPYGLTLESRAGEGTCITIRLPFVKS